MDSPLGGPKFGSCQFLKFLSVRTPAIGVAALATAHRVLPAGKAAWEVDAHPVQTRRFPFYQKGRLEAGGCRSHRSSWLQSRSGLVEGCVVRQAQIGNQQFLAKVACPRLSVGHVSRPPRSSLQWPPTLVGSTRADHELKALSSHSNSVEVSGRPAPPELGKANSPLIESQLVLITGSSLRSVTGQFGRAQSDSNVPVGPQVPFLPKKEGVRVLKCQSVRPK